MLAVRLPTAKPLHVNAVKGQGEIFKLPSGKDTDFTGLVPSSVQGRLYQLLVKPIEDSLNSLFDQLKSSPGGEVLTEQHIGIIQMNRLRMETALDQVRQIEIQEKIAAVGLKGFEATLNLEGIQIDINTVKKKDEFLKIIREYVFEYPTYEQWPPPLDTGYEFFKFDSSKRQDCCFYWPLYGYIQMLFEEEHQTEEKQMNLTDMFVLRNMQSYCSDPFPRQKKDTNVSSENKNKLFKNSLRKQQEQLFMPRMQPQVPLQQTAGYCMFGGAIIEEKEDNLPELEDPEEEIKKKLEERIEAEEIRQEIRVLRMPAPVAAFAFVCNPNKLKAVVKPLKRSLVEWKVKDQKLQTSEMDAMENIVVKYIDGLKDKDLLVEGRDIKDIYYSNDDDSIPDRDKEWSRQIILNEPAVKDPLLGVNYTWGNLIEWFGYPTITSTSQGKNGKSKTTKKQEKDNPQKIATHLLRSFKKHYTLTSSMFQLNDKTLEGVRRRFLKMMAAFFSLMKTMYTNVENKVIQKIIVAQPVKNVENRTQKLFTRIQREINQTTNQNKKEKLEQLRRKAKLELEL